MLATLGAWAASNATPAAELARNVEELSAGAEAVLEVTKARLRAEQIEAAQRQTRTPIGATAPAALT